MEEMHRRSNIAHPKLLVPEYSVTDSLDTILPLIPTLTPTLIMPSKSYVYLYKVVEDVLELVRPKIKKDVKLRP